ncbi:Uncharacterized protein PAE221_03240 [Pseudomonas aeruginosa]|nr:Uncharacterized protein PAE221_03240 [Pseudomonas aeruginosa]
MAERHRSPNRCAAPRRADEGGQGRYAEPVRAGEKPFSTQFLRYATDRGKALRVRRPGANPG